MLSFSQPPGSRPSQVNQTSTTHCLAGKVKAAGLAMIFHSCHESEPRSRVLRSHLKLPSLHGSQNKPSHLWELSFILIQGEKEHVCDWVCFNPPWSAASAAGGLSRKSSEGDLHPPKHNGASQELGHCWVLGNGHMRTSEYTLRSVKSDQMGPESRGSPQYSSFHFPL